MRNTYLSVPKNYPKLTIHNAAFLRSIFVTCITDFPKVKLFPITFITENYSLTFLHQQTVAVSYILNTKVIFIFPLVYF